MKGRKALSCGKFSMRDVQWSVELSRVVVGSDEVLLIISRNELLLINYRDGEVVECCHPSNEFQKGLKTFINHQFRLSFHPLHQELHQVNHNFEAYKSCSPLLFRMKINLIIASSEALVIHFTLFSHHSGYHVTSKCFRFCSLIHRTVWHVETENRSSESKVSFDCGED